MTAPADGLSTSARLAKAERERDEARGQRDKFIAAADKLHGEWLDLKAEIGRLKAEAVTSADNYLLVAAELSSARQDLDVLRKSLKGSATTASVALRDLAETRAQLADMQAAAEEKVRAVLTAPTGDVISQQTRYWCETCGARYGQPFDHPHGPLTSVTVTTTRAPRLFPATTTNQEEGVR
jgi:hypothetical protein